MIQATISPSSLQGTVAAPASKSAMQRACAAALIRNGKSILLNPGMSADDKTALNIIEQLGAEVEIKNDEVIINNTGIAPKTDIINCSESGLSARMFTSIAAISNKPIKITGEGSLLKRPFDFFDKIFPQIHITCKSANGFLPLNIQGPLKPENIIIDGSVSSQFLTGLLFAYSAANARNVTITVTNLNSKPYVDLTLEVLKSFGLKTPLNKNYKEFFFDDETYTVSTVESISFLVEGDWSNAAFLLTAGAIAGNISVHGLKMNSVQGDKAILNILKKTGAKIIEQNHIIKIQKSGLTGFEYDATDCPDLFPPLVSLASKCAGVSHIKGVKRLMYKESNRAASLQDVFRKMNVHIEIDDDVMHIHPPQQTSGGLVSSFNDHRIAMAAAITGLTASGDLIITDADAVNKSYPGFWNDIQKLGAAVSLADN